MFDFLKLKTLRFYFKWWDIFFILILYILTHFYIYLIVVVVVAVAAAVAEVDCLGNPTTYNSA
jgi:hypothetical protein